MERFIDRLRGGKLRPYTPDLLGDPVEYENTVREQVSEAFILRNHRAPTLAELGQLTRFAMEHSPVRGVQRFSRALLSGIPVIAADDVARYCVALPAGPSARPPGRMSAAELFSQLFPSGVQMTGELLADLEQ